MLVVVCGVCVHTVFYADGKGQQFYSVCWYLFRIHALCISVRETRTYSWFVFSFFFSLSLWYSENICKQIKPQWRYVAIVVFTSTAETQYYSFLFFFLFSLFYSSFSSCILIFIKILPLLHRTAFNPIIIVWIRGLRINEWKNSLNSIIDP